jgi:hypothetical protein
MYQSAPGTADVRGERENDKAQAATAPPPAISLPKGGGAIRGIGEKFAANPVTGTGSMTVPIATSPGRSGFGPQLSLSYDSGSGNGPFGFGWSLGLPQITRKTDKGLPKYRDAEESDVFILSGAEDLVPRLVQDGDAWVRESLPPRQVNGVEYRIQRYRPRIDGLFARIERWTSVADPADSFWRSISKDNITTFYGRTDESRIADPTDASRIFSWRICQSYDDKGNIIEYAYKGEDSAGIDVARQHEQNRTDDPHAINSRSINRYLKRIRYGNRTPYFPNNSPNGVPAPLPIDWMFEVVFDYGEHNAEAPQPGDDRATSNSIPWPVRNDPFSSYRAGFEVRTYRLCQRALMFHHFVDEPDVGADCLVRSTDFLKSVSITIPCVVGPYTNVNATLTLLSNRVRINGNSQQDYAYTGIEDTKFRHNLAGVQSIATSSGQNDSGLFQLNFQDERYLPFERAGAISRWRLSLPREFRPFDYDTISDVILHISYTARDGGDALRNVVTEHVSTRIDLWLDELAEQGAGLQRLVSLRREFPNELHRLIFPPQGQDQATELRMSKRYFPYFLKDRELTVTRIELFLKPKDGETVAFDDLSPQMNQNTGSAFSIHQQVGLPFSHFAVTEALSTEGSIWRFDVASGSLTADTIEDLYLLATYQVGASQ